jgi:hypothetical protein
LTPASTLTTTIPGQRGLWTFAGTAGQRVSFDFTGSTFTYASDATVKVRKPDGTDLIADTNCGTGCLLEPVTLPATGTYQVDLRPKGAKTGALTLRAYLVKDVTATITVDGVTSTLTTTTPGQNGTWTFTGTEGRYVNLAFMNGTFSSASDAAVSVRGPDGTVLREDTSCGKLCVLDPITLPASGTYTILFDPRKALAGSLTAQLTEGDVTGTTSVGGPASTLTTVGAGQKAVWTFTGTAGRRVSFNFTGSTLTSTYDAYVAVRKPDGTVLIDDTACGKNCLLDPAVLPVDGAYTVEFRPQNAKTGSITLQLHEVTHLSANVTLGGPASTLTTTTPGQNGTWSFAGTAGQLVSFNLTDASFASSVGAQVSVKKPDGTTLVSATYCGKNCFLEPVALPATGTYTVEFDPQDEKVGKLTLKVHAVRDLAPAAVTIGGTAVTLTTTTPGQNGSWTFSGTAGQQVAVTFTGTSFAASTDVRVGLLKPDGTALGSSPYCGRNCTIAATTLPATGTYTIVFNPQADKVGSLTAKVAVP